MDRFQFGDNWASYAETITDERVRLAEQGLTRLLGTDGLRGRSFLDIGSGSGIHSAAAARLGAAKIVAVDLDPNSVKTTRAVIARWAPDVSVDARQQSVFDIPDSQTFDIVYSWGVLHHTGAMWRAIEKAASLVSPGGMLAIALYGKTPLCGFWCAEKRLYINSPAFFQAALRGIYKGAFLGQMILRGQNPLAFVRTYQAIRGMNWTHDVHDWLGGYPYESATPDEVKQRLNASKFDLVRHCPRPPSRLGLFGTGCDEYVFKLSR